MNNPRVDNCPIDVYIASNMPYEYPYKLCKPEHVNQRVAESCDTLILDSGIGDDTTNSEVLDLAQKYDADFVVPCDELHDIPSTVKTIHEFMDLWQDHECRATPMLPLQPDHVECYDQVTESVSGAHWMLGGMAFDYSTQQIITAIERFRAAVGTGPQLHLLGVGANARLMDYLAAHPGAVQSLDCSTPEQCAINGNIYDVSLRQQNYQIRTGEDSSPTRFGLAKHLALMLNDAIRMRYENADQTSLGAFA